MLKAYTNLTPRTRLGVGIALLAWASAGLYLSDRAEEVFGYTPTEKERQELRDLAPRIVAVERSEGRKG